MITGKIAYELPDVLSEPKTINNFFTEEMFSRVKKVIDNTELGKDSLHYNTTLGRWETSGFSFDEDIEDYCLQKAKELFNDNSLQKTYFFATRYQRKECCVPQLHEHLDQNGTQTTIDITIENTAEWTLDVDGRIFDQQPNQAVIFGGQQHIHSRPPYPTKDLDKYVTVLFLHFTQPDHWMQTDRANGARKYGQDANIRFFNQNRFMPIPDTPLSQPWCHCHSYYHILGLYDTIVGHATDSEPEFVDTTILQEKELAKGIVEYTISKKSAHTLKGLIQNALIQQWSEAGVLANKGENPVNKNIRNCFNYTIKGKESTCHPQDPIRISTQSVNIAIDSAVKRFREKYGLAEVVSESTNLLRYEEGGHFVEHVDHNKNLPRVISASMFLNDNFNGGELEFKEFGLTIKPEAGKIIVFYSMQPYMHKVDVVKCGIRYAAVKWYRYL
jgi:hypothetical protein